MSENVTVEHAESIPPLTVSGLFDSWQAERAAAEALRIENKQLAKELLIARTQIAGLREIRRNRYRRF